MHYPDILIISAVSSPDDAPSSHNFLSVQNVSKLAVVTPASTWRKEVHDWLVYLDYISVENVYLLAFVTALGKGNFEEEM